MKQQNEQIVHTLKSRILFQYFRNRISEFLKRSNLIGGFRYGSITKHSKSENSLPKPLKFKKVSIYCSDSCSQ